jgi:hypothetical protein
MLIFSNGVIYLAAIPSQSLDVPGQTLTLGPKNYLPNKHHFCPKIKLFQGEWQRIT